MLKRGAHKGLFIKKLRKLLERKRGFIRELCGRLSVLRSFLVFPFVRNHQSVPLIQPIISLIGVAVVVVFAHGTVQY